MNGPIESTESTDLRHVVDVTGSGASAAESGAKLLGDFVERRDQQAFTRLVQLYGQMVFGVCRRIVAGHHDAEDAFQATFLILAQEAGHIKNHRALASWLFRVAYQVSLRKRTAIRRRQSQEQTMEERHEPMVVDSSVWSDLESIVDRELNNLAEKYRLPVLLCDLGGSTLKEAAAELGWSPGTLSTRLTKARTLLARRLSQQGIVLSTATLAVLLSQNAASAAVPASLVASTLEATGAVIAGNVTPSGLAASKLFALAQPTVKAIVLSQLKFVGPLLIVLIAVAGIGLQARRAKPEPLAAANLELGPAVIPGLQLPPEVRQALEENAAQLNPIDITFTEQLKSPFSEDETLAKLKLTREGYGVFSQEPLLVVTPRHFAWSGDQVYMSELRQTRESDACRLEYSTNGTFGYQGATRDQSDDPFNGERLEIFRNSNLNARKDLWLWCRAVWVHYFAEGYAGFVVNWDANPTFQLESSVLASLRKPGGTLVALSNATIDGRSTLKVEILIDNMHKKFAEMADTRRKSDNASADLPADVRERQGEINQLLLKAPSKIRVIYYLDPELHYAVRQREEYFDPDKLLLRCKCEGFEKLDDREVWLPRKYEVTYHTNEIFSMDYNLTATFLKKCVTVTSLNGKPAADDLFTLDYRRPNALIVDKTDPDEVSEAGAVIRQGLDFSYSVGNTAEETERNRLTARRAAEAMRKVGPAPATLFNTVVPADKAVSPAGNVAARSPKRWRLQWFIVVNVAILAAIGAVFAARRLFRS